jgi:hypothetical protein
MLIGFLLTVESIALHANLFFGALSRRIETSLGFLIHLGRQRASAGDRQVLVQMLWLEGAGEGGSELPLCSPLLSTQASH